MAIISICIPTANQDYDYAKALQAAEVLDHVAFLSLANQKVSGAIESRVLLRVEGESVNLDRMTGGVKAANPTFTAWLMDNL